ncbi:hypothetical protein AAHS21_12820 [Mycobacterium sp. 050272]|uniref:hypothetical protein n=1 Tax=Mycobacterium sp. 050272 TaxID=3142488 RepID=UPI003191E520
MSTDEHLGDQELPTGEVAWAGLPINLDFAFSYAQRDKVYAQHLLRKRWCALKNGSDANAADPATENGLLDSDAGHTREWLSDDRRHAG